MGKKKELGKGIRALLSNMESSPSIETKKEVVKELVSTVAEVPIDLVDLNPFQPRNVLTSKP